MQSPPLPQTQGAFSHPGPKGEAFGGLEVTRFLLWMVKAFTRQRKHREKGSQRPSSTSAGRDLAGEGRGLPDSLGFSPCLPHSVTLAFRDLQLDCRKEK